MALLNEDSDPVHKVTIIPRGMALGVTQTLPDEDRMNLTRGHLIDTIRHAMGGRAAEELIFHHQSTGASNDLEQATSWARRMVCKYGMSSLGPVSYGDEGGDVFLGRDFTARKDYSEFTAQLIDTEVAELLNRLYDEAKQLLEDNRDKLEVIAEALLERETLDRADLAILMRGEELPPLPTPLGEQGGSEKSGKSKPERDFPGGRIPDPEPVPS